MAKWICRKCTGEPCKLDCGQKTKPPLLQAKHCPIEGKVEPEWVLAETE